VSPVRYELRFYVSEDGNILSHRRENLKSFIDLCKTVGWQQRSIYKCMNTSVAFGGITLKLLCMFAPLSDYGTNDERYSGAEFYSCCLQREVGSVHFQVRLQSLHEKHVCTEHLVLRVLIWLICIATRSSVSTIYTR
jgi:hypothetical protein